MGDLATQYGYYGSDWGDNLDDLIGEAGEVRSFNRPSLMNIGIIVCC